MRRWVFSLVAGAVALASSVASASAPTVTIPDGLKPDTMASALLTGIAPTVVAVVTACLMLSVGVAVVRVIKRKATGAIKA